jgi:hypothetical protein
LAGAFFGYQRLRDSYCDIVGWDFLKESRKVNLFSSLKEKTEHDVELMKEDFIDGAPNNMIAPPLVCVEKILDAPSDEAIMVNPPEPQLGASNIEIGEEQKSIKSVFYVDNSDLESGESNIETSEMVARLPEKTDVKNLTSPNDDVSIHSKIKKSSIPGLATIDFNSDQGINLAERTSLSKKDRDKNGAMNFVTDSLAGGDQISIDVLFDKLIQSSTGLKEFSFHDFKMVLNDMKANKELVFEGNSVRGKKSNHGGKA